MLLNEMPYSASTTTTAAGLAMAEGNGTNCSRPSTVVGENVTLATIMDSMAHRNLSNNLQGIYPNSLRKIDVLMHTSGQSLPPYQPLQGDVDSPQFAITLIRMAISEYSNHPGAMLTALFKKLQDWNQARSTPSLCDPDFFCTLSPHLDNETVREYLRTAFINHFSSEFLQKITHADAINILADLDLIFPARLDSVNLCENPVSDKTESEIGIDSETAPVLTKKRAHSEIEDANDETGQLNVKKRKTRGVENKAVPSAKGLLNCTELQRDLTKIIGDLNMRRDKTQDIFDLLKNNHSEILKNLNMSSSTPTPLTIFKDLKAYDPEWVTNFFKKETNYKFLPETFLSLASFKLEARTLALDIRLKTVCSRKVQKILTYLAEIYINGQVRLVESTPTRKLQKVFSQLNAEEVKTYLRNPNITEDEIAIFTLFSLPKITGMETIKAAHEYMPKLLQSGISIKHFLTCFDSRENENGDNLLKKASDDEFVKFYLIIAKRKIPHLLIEGERNLEELYKSLKLIQRLYTNGVINLYIFQKKLADNPRLKIKDKVSIEKMDELFDSVRI